MVWTLGAFDGSYFYCHCWGLNRSDIFVDKDDYDEFMGITESLVEDGLNGVEINAFGIRPEGIHLIVHQSTVKSGRLFIKKLQEKYNEYFRAKYQRQEFVFEDPMTIIPIRHLSTLLYFTHYIHRLSWDNEGMLMNYSSYGVYVGKKHINWVRAEKILSFFRNSQVKTSDGKRGYEKFIKSHKYDSDKKAVMFEQILLQIPQNMAATTTIKRNNLTIKQVVIAIIVFAILFVGGIKNVTAKNFAKSDQNQSIINVDPKLENGRE